MTISTIFLFTITELVLCLTPGPAVLLIFSQGIIHGTKKSISGIMGVLIGNLIFFTLSAVGIGAVLVASESMFLIIRTLGAIYLIYLGVQFITKAKTSSVGDTQQVNPNTKLFFQGLLTQLSNPKAIVFFVSLYPQFISLDSPPIEQFAIMGVISVLIEFQVLLGYSWIAGQSKRILRKSVFQTAVNRLGGVFLIGAGLRLLTLRNEA